jgi:hypothetical protein
MPKIKKMVYGARPTAQRKNEDTELIFCRRRTQTCADGS